MEFKDFYNQKLIVETEIPKTPGHIPIAVFPGRFEPFHLGHLNIVKTLKTKTGLPIVIFVVKGAISSKDVSKNPFPFNIQKYLIQKSAGNLVQEILEAPNGFIPELVAIARLREMEIKAVACGPDRKNEYQRMLSKIPNNLDVHIDLVTINERYKTKDGIPISATSVREAIQKDDYDTFKSMTFGYSKEDFLKLADRI